MNTPLLSTSRLFQRTFALCISCALIPACNSKNSNDWFRFGHKEPAVTDQRPESDTQIEPPPTEPVSLPQDTTSDTEPPANQPTESEPDQKSAPPTSIDESIEEIVALYRRLHVEMPPDNRSQLIVELLSDPRQRVCRLGFDLASRDLSSGAKLTPEAAHAAVGLLADPRPSLRIEAARLISRLALPDAMLLLTEALSTEHDPAVAESLLQGLNRWPNPEARDDVLRWYQSTGQARTAAASVAWELADLELWDLDTHAPILRSVYRTLDDNQLTTADLRLIATTGTHDDLERLITLARNHNNPSRMHAAEALARSPAGVDPLLKLATDDPNFSPAAAQAIESHRRNPQGIAHLAALPWNNSQARTDALIAACNRLDLDQLAVTVRLARTDNTLSDPLAIRILNRLIAGTQGVSPRSAPGVVMLADLELHNQRPDRALEALSLIPTDGIDPDSSLRAAHINSTANILLTQFDTIPQNAPDPNPWLDALSLTTDKPTRRAIIQHIQTRDLDFNQEQQAQIHSLFQTLTPEPDPESDPEPDQSTEQP